MYTQDELLRYVEYLPEELEMPFYALELPFSVLISSFVSEAATGQFTLMQKDFVKFLKENV